MKIDWDNLAYIVIAICILIGICFEYKTDNDLKIEQIKYCIQMKIEKCPEVK